MEFISCQITSLVINSLGGGHTHTHAHTHTHTHTDVRTETIFKTRHAPACGRHANQFSNSLSLSLIPYLEPGTSFLIQACCIFLVSKINNCGITFPTILHATIDLPFSTRWVIYCVFSFRDHYPLEYFNPWDTIIIYIIDLGWRVLSFKDSSLTESILTRKCYQFKLVLTFHKALPPTATLWFLVLIEQCMYIMSLGVFRTQRRLALSTIKRKLATDVSFTSPGFQNSWTTI